VYIYEIFIMYAYSTSQAAIVSGFSVSTIRAYHSRHGHFHGIKPGKDAAGRLLWPAAEINAIGAQTALKAGGRNHGL
jgi:hypothetical protein